MSAEILFTVNDFHIKKDTLYQVTTKLDSSAPEGFKEYKTTKVLRHDVGNSEPGAVWDGAKGVWDTGLYISSSALSQAIPNETERAKLVKDLDKYIVKPIEVLKGKDALSPQPSNNHFWDNFQTAIKKDRIFNTAKPDELLELFLSVLHKRVTPSHLESHPDFKTSQYCIIDKEDAVDRQLQTEMETMEANGIFYQLMSNKKSDLISMLDYLGMTVSETSESTVLASVFSRYLKDKTDGYQNSRVFLNTYKKFSTEEGENELFFYSKLKKLFSKGKIKQKKGEVWFEDTFLGHSFKLAAAEVVKDKELQKQILELE